VSKKIVQFGPSWDDCRGPHFVESSPRLYSNGEQITDPEVWGLAFAIEGFAFDLYCHAGDWARELARLLPDSKRLRVVGTIEPEHKVNILDHKMVLRLEFELEEVEGDRGGCVHSGAGCCSAGSCACDS